MKSIKNNKSIISLKKNILIVAIILAMPIIGAVFEKVGLPNIVKDYDIFNDIDVFKVLNPSININTKAKSIDIQKLIDSIELSEIKYFDYDRKDWEKPVRKFNGKSIRNYSLSISLNNVSKDDIFEYLDPFTGDIINETEVIDYDHIIPLSYVEAQIGDTWSNEAKNEYSFNIYNGVNTHRSENRAKGNKGPSKYLPAINKEEYCYSWLVIANAYSIPLRTDDMLTIKEILKDVDIIDVINSYQ